MYDRIETPSLPSYAGFWVRLWATLIDGFLYLLLSILLSLVWRLSLGTTTGIWWNIAIGWALPPLATIAFWARFGGTPGKIVNALRIVDARDQSRPGLGRLVVRYLAYFVSGLPFGLGFVWVSMDNRKQGWHDKLSGTLVVREGPALLGVGKAASIAVIAVLALAAWNRFSGRPVDPVAVVRDIARNVSQNAPTGPRELTRFLSEGPSNLRGIRQKVDDLALFEGEAAEPVPIPVSDLEKYVGRMVQITSEDGDTFRAILTEAKRRQVVLEQRIATGSMTAPLARSEIEKVWLVDTLKMPKGSR